MKRFNNISLYRLIATLCILQFHIFYILFARAIPYEMLLSKGVQGLTALSGFLYSQKLITDNKKFYGSNLLKLIIPALVCVLFMVTWDTIYMAITREWGYEAFITYRAYGGRVITQADNYYYLGYIFICYLITPVLQRNDKWSVVVIVGVIAVEVLVGFFFGPAMIAVSYIAGYYIGKKWFKTYTDTKQKYSVPHLLTWTGILGTSIGLYILIHTYEFGGSYFLNRTYSLTNNIIVTIFGIATLFFFLMAFKFLNKFKGFPPFKYTDKLSLIIYLMNQAFMCGGMAVTLYVHEWWSIMLLIYVFTIGASVLLQFISELILKAINKPKQTKPEESKVA